MVPYVSPYGPSPSQLQQAQPELFHPQPQFQSEYMHHVDFDPNFNYAPNFTYPPPPPPPPEQEHLDSIYNHQHQNQTQTHHQNIDPRLTNNGGMNGTGTGNHQVLGHQALGNGTATFYDYPSPDLYTYPYTELPHGAQDLNFAPAMESLNAPIQSIEQPAHHGSFTNPLQAAAYGQSSGNTRQVNPRSRAGSRNSQAVASATPEINPLFAKPPRKKRNSSSAESAGFNKRRRISDEERLTGKKSTASPQVNTNTQNTPQEPMHNADGGRETALKNPQVKKPTASKAPESGPSTSKKSQEKRKRDAAPPSSNKRQRKSDGKTAEEQLEDEFGSELDGEEEDITSANDVTGATDVVFVSPDQQPGGQHDQAVMSAKAREAGVHSASALFRPASEASKRYSRKPMSQLYDKLQVSPEQFLHLQAAAKDYMLDPEHLERREVIGKRHGVELSSVKLKLYKITSSFLYEKGWGERCWGPKAPRLVEREVHWPEAEPDIVGMLLPLMRRMITNENQRLYAEEKRISRVPYTSGNGRHAKPEEILERLKGHIYGSRKSQSPTEKNGSDSTSPGATGENSTNPENGENTSPQKPPSQWDGMKFYINLNKNGRRAMPRVEFSTDNDEGFSELVQHVDIIIDDDKTHKVKILGPAGLVDITDEVSWKKILTEIKETVWMDGEVRICVDMDA